MTVVPRPLWLAATLVSILTPSVDGRAHDARDAPAPTTPRRLSRRCTAPTPSDFRTTPLYGAAGINDAGTLAGTTSTRTGQPVHAALGLADGTLVDLFGGDLRGTRAAAINDAGVVVGEVSIIRASGQQVRTPFRFVPGIGIEDLPPPTAGGDLTVRAVNARGDILMAQGARGFVWSVDSRAYVELTGLGHGTGVADLNDAGDVVGHAYDESGTRHAALWRGQPYALTLLTAPDAAEAGPWSSHDAVALNDRGTIVGSSCNASRCLASAWVGPTHTFKVLGPGGYPTDVNAQDFAVGSPASLELGGVLIGWDVATGEEIRLPMPTPYLHIAMALNDHGDAVGFRRDVEPDHLPAVRFPRVVCED